MSVPSASYSGFADQLTPHQKKLLQAAFVSLNAPGGSNQSPQQQQDPSTVRDNSPLQSDGIDPSVFDSSINSMSGPPVFGEGLLPNTTVNGNSDFDVDVDLGANGFDDEDFGNFDSFDGEPGEKRKSHGDDDDDEGDSKRRESDDKGPKKPGRKPLTSEPTTKRKAQNRAAQRAFRERKERHLKDLEDKVSSLEQASESANHENEALRAQVIKLQSQLQDYRKRLSVAGTALNGSPPPASDAANYRSRSSGGSYDFAFDFPNFGNVLTGKGITGSPTDAFNVKQESTSQSNSAGASPQHHGDQSTGSPSYNGSYAGRGSQSSNTTNGVFSPNLFNLSDANYGFPTFGSPSPLQQSASPPAQNGTRSNSTQAQSNSGSATSNAASPSGSSMSHNGVLSSAGTSPEPGNGYSNGDTVKTNGEPKGISFLQDPQQNNFDLSGFQFDPTLFGGYRETQEAIYGEGDFSGGLYDDYLNLQDFDANTLNSNANGTRNAPAPQSTQKQTLLDQVEEQQTAAKLDETTTNANGESMMTCHKIWEELNECPKFKEGDLDIDGLCSELSKKATCTEKGAAIPKAEWDAALWRLIGQDQPDASAKNSPSKGTATAK